MFKGNLTNLIITLLTILVTIMLYLREVKDGGIKIDFKLTIERPQPPQQKQPDAAIRTVPRLHASH